MKHEIFEEVATEIKLENNKEETDNEANARKVGNCELCNFCGKAFRKFAQLRYRGMVVHKQKAVGCTGFN